MLNALLIQNYKSLHEVSLRPPPFMAVVGANAAGKSNFVDAIEFISSIARSGLAAALSQKGGYENVCFRRQRRSKGAIEFYVESGPIPFVQSEYSISLRLRFRARKSAIRSEYEVENEEIRVVEPGKVGHSDAFRLVRTSKTIDLTLSPAFSELLPRAGVLRTAITQLKERQLLAPADESLMWVQLRSIFPFRRILDAWSTHRVFQIAPNAARRPGAASGSSELGRSGENLPAVLEWLRREQKSEYDRLLQFVQLAVPTIERIETDYVPTRELGLFVKEKHIGRKMFASELSDGTVRTLAMFIPLVDPRHQLVVIEEPENSVHPWVVRHFVDACREASRNKQVILTTHSPVLVSHLRPEELFLAERAKGATSIVPAAEAHPELADVIKNGIQDLGAYWDSGAMRAVPSQAQFEFMSPLDSP